MDSVDRLRLMRAFYALSQAEMGDLVGIGRTFYAAIESGRRKLPATVARSFGSVLGVDDNWLLGKAMQPLTDRHLLIVGLPSRKILAAARNTRVLRRNYDYLRILNLWPQFLRENPPQGCWFAEVPGNENLKIVLVCFNYNQGILFRIDGARSLAKSIIDAVRRIDEKFPVQLEIDRATFEAVPRDLTVFSSFLERCGIERDVRESFVMSAENTLSANRDLTDHLSEVTRKAVIEKVCAELMANDIGVSEVARHLAACGREDLIKTTSH